MNNYDIILKKNNQLLLKKRKKEKKYGAHSHVRATARLEEHFIHSRGQPYVVRLSTTNKKKPNTEVCQCGFYGFFLKLY